MNVVMLADVFDSNGQLLANGSSVEVSESVALDLLGTGRAIRSVPWPFSVPALYEVAAAEAFLLGPDGIKYPLAWVVGTIEEGMVAGKPQAIVAVDSGSDTVNHGQILWTANCTLAGQPDVPDDALASARFAAYATDGEVYKSGVDGASSGESFALRYPSLTQLHFALAGGGSYSAAADNVLTGTQMVKMAFPEALGVIAAEIKLLSATLGTSGWRYRQIVVTPFSA